MASERKQRKLIKEVLGENLTMEKVAFTSPFLLMVEVLKSRKHQWHMHPI